MSTYYYSELKEKTQTNALITVLFIKEMSISLFLYIFFFFLNKIKINRICKIKESLKGFEYNYKRGDIYQKVGVF